MTFVRDFLKCGVIGWCMEIVFTAMDSLRRRNLKLTGVTSLWMFPIYGCAALFRPVYAVIRKAPIWVRGLSYMSLIFSTEYLTGYLLDRRGVCPWDYSRSRFNIHRYIRLDYAPYWFAAGLFFERILIPTRTDKA